LVQSWKQIDESEICICDERDLIDSAIRNMVHLTVYNNGDGVEQSSNTSCVYPSLFSNRGASFPEKRDMEHIPRTYLKSDSENTECLLHFTSQISVSCSKCIQWFIYSFAGSNISRATVYSVIVFGNFLSSSRQTPGLNLCDATAAFFQILLNLSVILLPDAM
jgi:hypothetical protein